ncbi:MAG: glycoside hydrolase family 172 protein [Candidatus Aminicenantales bacterium]
MPKSGKFLLAVTPVFLSLTLFVGETSAQGLDELMRIRPGRSRAVTSADPSPNGNADRIKYVAPGETKVLADLRGPGIIRHIWLTFNEARPNWLEATGSAGPDEIVLRMYWDGAEKPDVEAPIGDFFGAGFGRRLELKSVPVQVESGDGYNCYWPMPFHERALITITNENPSKNVRSFYYHIDYSEEEKLPGKTAYFCAQYRNEFPEKEGGDYLILDAEGEGQYVGTVMSARSRSPFWFGEGDAKFYIDGDAKPTIQGTGTEDYFLMAWGLAETQFPYYGCTYMSSDFEDLGTEYCMYRWHIADPVRFSKSLRFEIEHTGWISADETESGKIEGHVAREDDLATVAFWYQVGHAKRFTALPPLAQRRLPNLDIVIEGNTLLPSARHSTGILEAQKGFDWTGEGQLLFQPASDQPELEVDFQVEKEEYRGLILRFTYAEDYGIYRIFLDGKNVRQPDDYMAGQKIEDYDFYAKGLQVRDSYLGSFKLAPGKHTLRLEGVGRNLASKGNYLGLDSIRLRERWNKKRKLLS